MQYETLGHTPLMIAYPGVPPKNIDQLTTNVDLYATLADLFDISPQHKTHGQSLLPTISSLASETRDWAIGGIFGNWVQIQDGRYKYARAPVGDNFPLSMWSNRWSTMPVPYYPGLRLPEPDHRAYLDYMPGSNIPVIRQPFQTGDMLPFWCLGGSTDDHYLFDIDNDPDENENLIGTKQEARMIELMEAALDQLEAPTEQAQRLGLPSAG